MRTQRPAVAALNAAVIGGASQKERRAPPALTNLRSVSWPEKAIEGGPRFAFFLAASWLGAGDAGGDRDMLVLEDDQAAVDVAVDMAEGRLEKGIVAQLAGKAVDQGLDPEIVGEEIGDDCRDVLGLRILEAGGGAADGAMDGAAVPAAPNDRMARSVRRCAHRSPSQS